MKPDVNLNGPWELRVYSDVEYAGYNDTQKIVTGYIVLIDWSVIAWRLRSQKIVTLSVTESKYSEIIEVSFEILFYRMISLFMGVVA